MATNKDLLAKAFKYLSGALPLLFMGPAVIHNAFMNQKNNQNTEKILFGSIELNSVRFD